MAANNRPNGIPRENVENLIFPATDTIIPAARAAAKKFTSGTRQDGIARTDTVKWNNKRERKRGKKERRQCGKNQKFVPKHWTGIENVPRGIYRLLRRNEPPFWRTRAGTGWPVEMAAIFPSTARHGLGERRFQSDWRYLIEFPLSVERKHHRRLWRLDASIRHVAIFRFRISNGRAACFLPCRVIRHAIYFPRLPGPFRCTLLRRTKAISGFGKWHDGIHYAGTMAARWQLGRKTCFVSSMLSADLISQWHS